MSPPTTSRPRLAHSAAISSLAVMGSRLMGLLREQIFAYFFGASREYDAFLTAFRIPNLLRDLLAEGALSSAFVTVFVRELSDHGQARAYEVANRVAHGLALLLLGLVLVGIVWAPSLVHGMALGFDADKVLLTASLTRLMFPFILFVALAAVCMGALNAQGRYGLPQSASTFFNITSIVAGLACAYLLAPDYVGALWARTELGAAHDPTGLPALLPWPEHLRPAPARAMVGMACGTLLGGFVQWWVQMLALWRLGYRYVPTFSLRDPAVRDVLRLMGPAVLGAGAVQLSVFINSNFASTLGDRPISWLSYSFRLMQFPIGVFGVAIMTATLPALSRHRAQSDARAFGETFAEALALVVCLTVPATCGLILLAEPILRLLFEHGRFTHDDTLACAQSLCAYALGLVGYSALKVVQPAFVARGDAKTPMRVSLAGVALTLGFNYVFVVWGHLGHVGLALSTSIMATTSTAVLLVLFSRQQDHIAWRYLLQEAGRVAANAVLMGVGLALGLRALDALGLGHTTWGALVQLGLLMPLAAAMYGAGVRLFKIRTFYRVLGPRCPVWLQIN